MKKSELKTLIKEEIKKLNEYTLKSITIGELETILSILDKAYRESFWDKPMLKVLIKKLQQAL